MKRDGGQALIEAVAFFMALIGMVVCLLGFTKWFLVRQKLLIAVRQGAMSYSSGRMTEEEVHERLVRFLTSGSPVLKQGRLSIAIGAYKKWKPTGMLHQLDIVRIRYTSQSPWYSLTNLNPTMEEKCIVKHAATYGPALQWFYGPPVSWPESNAISD